uniref:Retrovirus-related Pol polyprotein from transposon TNT 1-94-like beta-barrel domain-containing protein n=1 Tax=Phytophthora ramorum TaxID=164328 RepID=H3H469_PHYRM
MSPTQASPTDDRDFPRLNGRNFVIWKTRVTAALEGKNLIGFVTQADYAGESESDFSDEDELDPKYSTFFTAENNQAVKKTLDEIGAPSADAPSSSSSEASDDSTAVANEDGDGDVEMDQENLPVIQSFTAKKQLDRQKAERQRVRRPKLSSKTLRRMEAKAKAFLMKTIDDQHVLMIKAKKTPYEIFTTLCAMYEDTAIHGDPYYIMNYLMALKYEEGTDLNKFIYEMEEGMKAASDTTNSVMTDEQKTIYLYHALPDVWKVEMAAWKGSRKYVPYEELKRHIETKGDYKNRGGDRQPRSRYNNGRGNDNHNENDRRHNNRGRPDRHGRQSFNKFRGRRNKEDNASDGSEYGIIAITTLDLTPMKDEISLTAQDVPHDPAWTIDSGCTRYVTSSPHWFEDLKPIIGKTITVGGNHQIPILGKGTVNMTVTDTKGSKRIISLSDVLYAPELKFNLLSVRQAVDGDYKINFPNAKKCVLFYAHRTKFEAKTGEGTNLYQFKALPTDSDQAAHVANTGSG